MGLLDKLFGKKRTESNSQDAEKKPVMLQPGDTEMHQSPDGKHHFHFLFEGEIRFGPNYYQVKIDGQMIPGKIFGYEFLWHPESTFLVLQEWLTTDYQEGPITVLNIIDLTHKKIARIGDGDNGWVKPMRFEKNLLIFEREYRGFPIGFQIVEFEININEIKDWE